MPNPICEVVEEWIAHVTKTGDSIGYISRLITAPRSEDDHKQQHGEDEDIDEKEDDSHEGDDEVDEEDEEVDGEVDTNNVENEQNIVRMEEESKDKESVQRMLDRLRIANDNIRHVPIEYVRYLVHNHDELLENTMCWIYDVLEEVVVVIRGWIAEDVVDSKLDPLIIVPYDTREVDSNPNHYVNVITNSWLSWNSELSPSSAATSQQFVTSVDIPPYPAIPAIPAPLIASSGLTGSV